jgi:hypothetical protein
MGRILPLDFAVVCNQSSIGTPRDKPTNVLVRCATQQAVGSPFKHKRILFPLSSNDPTLVLALLIER